LDIDVTGPEMGERVVSASRDVDAPSEVVFELIADVAQQPRWDGNDNLADAPEMRVRAAGEVFAMTLTNGQVRHNHVVEFEEGRRIAWQPSDVDKPAPGHLWRWEVAPLGESRCRVTHTYDWTRLTDTARMQRARATTAERLAESVARLAAIAEQS
jgi:uncharacterized protein YndB with AHSA1/START domain